jgi:hypothetical protein
MDDDEGIIWAAVTAAVTIAAGSLARKLMTKTWSSRRGFVPGAPGDGKTTWREAAAFAVISGATVGLSRLIADRVIAEAKRRSSTHPA